MSNIAEYSTIIVDAICASVLGGCEDFSQREEGDGFIFAMPEGEGTIKIGKPGTVVTPGSIHTLIHDQGWTVTLPDGRTATHPDPVRAIDDAVRSPAGLTIWTVTGMIPGDEPFVKVFRDENEAWAWARAKIKPDEGMTYANHEARPVITDGSGAEATIQPHTLP